MKTVDSCSSIGTFQDCNRKYLYSYERLLESRGYTSALGTGSFVHAFIESFSGKGRLDAPEQELSAQKQRTSEEFHAQVDADFILAKQMAALWRINWEDSVHPFANSAFQWIDAEAEWRFMVGNVEHVGKRDGLLLHKAWNKTFLYELKTATATGEGTYFNRLEMDRQISSNILALRANGVSVDGVVYDVIFKPAIRMLKDRKTKPDETPAEFNARMIETMANDRPKHFQRQIIYRSELQLENHLADLKHTLTQMEVARAGNAWPRNTNACDNFGKLCPYFAACLGGSSEADLELTFRKRDRKLGELTKETNGT